MASLFLSPSEKFLEENERLKKKKSCYESSLHFLHLSFVENQFKKQTVNIGNKKNMISQCCGV